MPLGNNGFNPTVGDLVKVTHSSSKEIGKGRVYRIVRVSKVPGLYYLEGCEANPVRRHEFEVVAYKAVSADSKGRLCHDKGNLAARQ